MFTGETEKLVELLLEGYDHLLDIEDDEDQNILDIVSDRQQNQTLAFLRSVPAFEVSSYINICRGKLKSPKCENGKKSFMFCHVIS